MALTKEGFVYAWGEATLGQLGLDDIRDLPKNTEQKPYQPYPTKVMALTNKKIVSISCGETHTLALTDGGHLYSFGANGCGQLGQFQNEYDRRRRSSFEEIIFPKIQIGFDGGNSFLSGFDTSSVNSSPRDSKHENDHDENNVVMTAPLNSPPPLQSAHDYGIETICYSPKLVKSLMHRRVIRISSGGVHNICIVEPQPSCILRDVYSCFKEKKFTDIIFKGFYQTDNQKQIDGTQNQNSNDSSEKASDDEAKDDAFEESGESINQSKAAAQESYWREKPRILSTK